MSNAGHVSKRELRQEVTNPLCNIRYASSIPGLAPFLVQKRKVPYLIPHAFVTFSAADTHWIDFHNLIEKKKAYMLGHPVVDLKGLPEREAQLPIFNHILKQQEFLYDRFTIFLNTVVYKGKSSLVSI